MKLLTRDEFRRAVMERSQNICCVPGCNRRAEDAHHIIERRLWPDGGYYAENGAALCDASGTGHHMQAEKNLITPRQLREWCGIEELCLPPDWDDSLDYDKWGKITTWSGKYPRTYHLPTSLTKYKDDKTLSSMEGLKGLELVVTEKMDGENTTMTRERIHARSVDSDSHDSQSWVRNLWSKIRWDIPENMRLVGENMYAVHSIRYDDLSGYFYMFSVIEERNDGVFILSWDDTVEYAEYFEMPIPAVLYRGDSLEDALKAWTLDPETSEGFVVRVAGEIPLEMWSLCAGKHVRQNHVRTLDHGWRFKTNYEVNGLRV